MIDSNTKFDIVNQSGLGRSQSEEYQTQPAFVCTRMCWAEGTEWYADSLPHLGILASAMTAKTKAVLCTTGQRYSARNQGRN